MNNTIPLNTGLIIDQPLETDLYFGSNTRVNHQIKLTDRNWLPYYSNGESQIGAYYDTAGCVSFSANKIVEAILNYMLAHDMISGTNKKWLENKGYIGEDGKVNLSDRFTTAMSGTRPTGNTGGAVWWTIRNKGVVPESACPWNRGSDVEDSQKFASWYRSNSNVSSNSKALGLEFVKRFKIFYERININDTTLKHGLKRSPVQVYIPTSCPVKNTIQQYCDAPVDHAVSMCDDSDPRGYYPLFDHYIKQKGETGQEKWIRRVTKDYKFYPTGYVATIQEKKPQVTKEDIIKKYARKLVTIEGDPAYYYVGDKLVAWIKNEESFDFGRDNGWWGDWDDAITLEAETNITHDIIF